MLVPQRRNHAKPRNPAPLQRHNIPRRKLSVRQRKLLEGLKVGKSTRRAALDAGYSNYAAGHPAELLDKPALRDALCQMIAPIEMIAERINQGLDATEVRTFARVVGSKQKGTQRLEIEPVELVNWSERRKYAELAIRLKGLDPSINHDVQECNESNSLIVRWENIGCPDCGSKQDLSLPDAKDTGYNRQRQ